MKSPTLLDVLVAHSLEAPRALALRDAHGVVTWADLPARVLALRDALLASGIRSAALLADNGIDWVLVDLAAACAGIPLLPLPPFFSDEQLAHAVSRTRPDAILTDDVSRLERALALHGLPGSRAPARPCTGSLLLLRREDGAAPPSGMDKVTFTSGSTGRPKGVCLTTTGQLAAARALRAASGMDRSDVHLCTVPLAVLLEDVAGVWRTLLAGGCVIVPPATALGGTGGRALDGGRLAQALFACAATSVIFTPEVLSRLLGALRGGAPRPRALRFAGVGGATVPPALLRAATAAGLPVFEGYGLSEATSVVSLNTPDACRIGSVGRPLSHVRVRIDACGEISVSGPGVMTGYLGETARARDEWLPTGDLGAIDADGFLYLRGRIKNVFVTSNGRNVSPEWIEGLLLELPGVYQAVVYGEGRPGPVAVLVTDLSDHEVERAVRRLDDRLPDYAHIQHWVRADEPFSVANGQWLATGRPSRDAIFALYGGAFDTVSRITPSTHPLRS